MKLEAGHGVKRDAGGDEKQVIKFAWSNLNYVLIMYNLYVSFGLCPWVSPASCSVLPLCAIDS